METALRVAFVAFVLTLVLLGERGRALAAQSHTSGLSETRSVATLVLLLTVITPPVVIAVLTPFIGRVRRRKGLPPVGLLSWLPPALGVPPLMIVILLLSTTRYSFVPILFVPTALLVMICWRFRKRRVLRISNEHPWSSERAGLTKRRKDPGKRRHVLAFTVITVFVLATFALVVEGGIHKGARLNATDWSWMFADFSVFLWVLGLGLRLLPEGHANGASRTPRPRLAAMLFAGTAIVLLAAMCGPATHHPGRGPYQPIMFAAFASRLAVRYRARHAEPWAFRTGRPSQ